MSFKIKKFISVLISAVMVTAMFLQPVSAAGGQISFEVEYRQTDARSMLDMLNDWRTSGTAWYWNSTNTAKVNTGVLPAMTYDYNLEQIAMQRAREIILSWGHQRADGRSFQSWAATDSYDGTKTVAENIAGGSARTDAAAAFEGWQETNANYSGQGHRRTMLDSEYTAVGIAHIYYNGTHYWVQEFGYSNSGASAFSAVDRTMSVSVYYGSQTLKYTIDSEYSFLDHNRSMDCGDYDFLPSCNVVAEIVSSTVTGVVVPSTGGTWTSSNPSVVKIEGNKYYGLAAGTSVMTYSAVVNGNTVSKSMTMTVNAATDISSAKVTCESGLMYTGSEVCPEVTVTLNDQTLTEGVDYSLSFTNNVAPGFARGTITGLGQFAGSSKTFSFYIMACHIYYPLSTATISSQEYTGDPIVPSLNLTYNGMTLVEGTDYEVEASNNTNVGAANITITGLGNYNGSCDTQFYITKRNVSNTTVSPIPDQTYTGSAITPSVTITNGTRTLTEGTDYTVKYSSNTAVGTAIVTITGTGNYRGTRQESFKIVDPAAAVTPAKVVSSSLAVEDRVGVNFYLTLPEAVLNSNGAYIQINDTQYGIPAADARGRYPFRYYIASGEQRDELVLSVHLDDENVYPLQDKNGLDVTSTGYVYTAVTYTDDARAGGAGAGLIGLLERLNDFGKFAQIYFNHSADLGSLSDLADDVSGVTLTTLNQYAPVITTAPNSGIRRSGSTLMLESATTLTHNFIIDEGSVDDYVFMVNGNVITTSTTGDITLTRVNGKYRISIGNIVAAHLQDVYEVVVTDKAGNELIKISNYSAMSYAHVVISSVGLNPANEKDAQFVRLLQSMYRYNVAAREYFGVN
ncbi:MAG: CAP domain-containing protein [Saccharofermentans sp.]|nr:CAP domain-containing protein [Saccharofermentans sp.]